MTQRAVAAGWTAAAKHWSGATRAVGAAYDAAHLLPSRAIERATALARRVLDPDVVPPWSADLPGSGTGRIPRSLPKRQPDAVLFSSCTGTMFGPTQLGAAGAGEAFARSHILELLERATRTETEDAGQPRLTSTPEASATARPALATRT
ncbi:hypothetical protein [Streptomyces melanosporofaciens]|uniref:hypothetical protein n=1 Tax=Streptomyces melanosporofaciens TaxID=67327 RepID=UPI000AD68CE1|nr:hypothetical protein [Streptomyces melanosporofaciens]